MRIYLFAQHYPVPYKSYYDTQFADLISKGHDITIWAGSGLDDVLNEKVVRFALERRTRRYPTTLRSLARFAPTLLIRFVKNPRWAMRTARTILHRDESPKERVMHLARALVLGPAEPDLCFIHELGTAVMFPFLRDVYARAATGLYYHGGETPIVTPLQRARAEAAFRSVGAVFSNTEFSCRHAVERGCPSSSIQILPVGFAVEEFNPPRIRPYRKDGTLRLLSAGRMSDEKGFLVALEAIAQLVAKGTSNISYSLTGEGYLRPRLEEYVRRNSLGPYVHFLGTLSTEEVLQAMLDADALLLPSLEIGNWAENQACAVQEAMLMKTLVITTTTGGVPESIPEAFREFSVPPGDAPALAAAIARIDELPDSEVRRLGEIGRSFVLRGYDVARLNEQLIARTLAARSTPAQPVDTLEERRREVGETEHLVATGRT